MLLVFASATCHATTEDTHETPHWDELLGMPVVERAVAGFLAADPNPVQDDGFVWTDSAGITDHARGLITEISLVSADGLNPEHYQLTELQTLLANSPAPADRGQLEERLNSVLTTLIRDLGQGVVDPTKVQKRWFEKPVPVDTEQALSLLKLHTGTIAEFIDGYRPSSSAYRLLSSKLRYYQQLEQAGGLNVIPEGPSIRPGEFDSRVPGIRAYLELTLDIEQPSVSDDSAYAGHHPDHQTDPEELTPELSAAVARFQRRHGLEDDGIAGKKTIAAMNVPVSDRVNQIKLNLERLRWFTRTPGKTHLLTNIPAYQLDYMVDEQSELNMPVVVGKKKFMTPVFSDSLRSIVFNPNWNVPRSIADRELIPREIEDPGYLARNNYELIQQINGKVKVTNPNDIPMADYRRKRFQYTIRQKPGSNNALGKLKFLFPNPYSIYLHDTPAKSLFKQHRRAYSHGCIRLAQPKTLAQTLLEQDEYKSRDVGDLYNSDATAWVNLNEPLANHIVYWTSWVDGEQNVRFAEDIYDHDAPLLKAMGTAILPPASIDESGNGDHPILLIADTGDTE